MSGRASRGALLVPALLAAPILAGAYADGPPPGHTGGFGEPTCRACHFDGPADDPAVSLILRGVPARWAPGATYPIEVVLARDGLPAGGFQLAARFAGGRTAGRQAGVLAAAEPRVAVVDSAGILYAQHAEGGTRPAAPDTVRWRVSWTAPAGTGGAVAFHVAANAANDDDSELGDSIVALEVRSDAPGEPGEAEGG